MFHSTSEPTPGRLHLMIVAALLVLVLNTMLTACSGSSQSISPNPTPHSSPSPSPNPQSACNQSAPAPAKGDLILAGLAYGPYHTGQDPNYFVFPSSDEVAADMPTLASLTNYIRIYSSTGPANAIIHEAEKTHLCVNLGIWLGKYPTGTKEANAKEMAAGEQLASSTAVRSITVGSEVILRRDMSEEQLIAAIEQVRAHLSRAVPITTADTYDQWLAHPNLVKHVDFITANIYPFWEKQSINSAIQVFKEKYNDLKKAYPDKTIVIGETGWPSDGPPQGAAAPSAENQARYFKEFINWAQSEDIQYFYFDAFDEEWKGIDGNGELGVGAHWGLYQQDGKVKPALSDVLPVAANVTLNERSYRDVYVGGLESGFNLGIDTSEHQYGWQSNVDGSALQLSYPANQQWGTMFITVNKPAPLGERHSFDLRAYNSLVFDIRAAVDGQSVDIGIIDADGNEATVPESLTTQWVTYTLTLSQFSGIDRKHLYVVFEVIFKGASSATIEVRNIRYLPT